MLNCPLTYPLCGPVYAPGCALLFDSLVHSPLRSPLQGLLLSPMIDTVRPVMRSLLRNPLRIRGKAMGCASIFPYNMAGDKLCRTPGRDFGDLLFSGPRYSVLDSLLFQWFISHCPIQTPFGPVYSVREPLFSQWFIRYFGKPCSGSLG